MRNFVKSEDENRWNGIKRPYSLEDVIILRDPIKDFAKEGSERLWYLLKNRSYVKALGAETGIQAKQIVQAGVPAIYLSGWQVAADANLAGETYPDQSIYPVNSVPVLVERINNALKRADQTDRIEGKNDTYWYAPIIADAEAGFGGIPNTYELMYQMIKAGAAGVHFEDQLSSAKKCGHLGGKVVVPIKEFEQKLIAARLAADVMDVPTILIARTDAFSAKLIQSNIDERDHPFIDFSGRTMEGFFKFKSGVDASIARGLAYAPYADLLWMETSTPDLDDAKKFADAIHEKFPRKMLAYNCSPSFNWKKNLDDKKIAEFNDRLGDMEYKFQFITLAGFHALAYSMFDLAYKYNREGMPAFVDLQEKEFNSEEKGFTAVRHQREAGAKFFDKVQEIVTSGQSSIKSLEGSTEEEQF